MPDETEELRELERQRLAAFVAGDVPALRALHADDLHLINPAGQELTKEDYIGGIAAGFIQYQTWQPESEIQVRLHGDSAALRYLAQVVIAVKGQVQPPQRFWQTELYEKRDGKWQVVWSQSTRVDF
jgi:uncharacterized protein (TIGR02246 family)